MCVLRGEVLQDLLVVTAVDVVAIDLQDDLTGLKARPCRLPACSMSTWDQRSKVTRWLYSETVYNTLGYYENMKSWKNRRKKCLTSVSHMSEKDLPHALIKIHYFIFCTLFLILFGMQFLYLYITSTLLFLQENRKLLSSVS